MALFSGRIAVRRALRVVGARHEHILSSVIGKPVPPAKWEAGVGDVGQVFFFFFITPEPRVE